MWNDLGVFSAITLTVKIGIFVNLTLWLLARSYFVQDLGFKRLCGSCFLAFFISLLPPGDYTESNGLYAGVIVWPYCSVQVDYRLGFQVENPAAMDQPHSNISISGEVPLTRSGTHCSHTPITVGSQSRGVISPCLKLNVVWFTMSIVVLNKCLWNKSLMR